MAGHRCRPAAPRAAAPPGGGLIDPSAGGKRRVVAPQKLDPSTLQDVRRAQAFGPRGLLLVGMAQAECEAVAQWFAEMEPGFVVSPCPAALLANGSLRDALGCDATGGSASGALPQRPWEAAPADTPPVAVFR